MHFSPKKILMSGLLIVGTISPQLVLAATPQQLLNEAFTKFVAVGPRRIDVEMGLGISTRPYKRSEKAEEFSTRLFMTQRMVPAAASSTNGEGRIVIKDAKSQGSSDSFSLPEPITFQWKMIDRVLYVRLEKFPESLAFLLKEEGKDVSSVIGQWIRIDVPESVLRQGLATGLMGTSSMPEVMKLMNVLKGKTLIQVVGVEKREVRANGDKVLRLVVRLNPQVITLMQREDLKAIAKNDPQRRQKIQAITKTYTDMQKMLRKIRMIAIVNQTTGALERVEFGMKSSEPAKTCTLNYKTERMVCPATGTKTTTLSLGMSFLKDSGSPISTPENTKTLDELLKLMRPEQPTVIESTETETTSL